MVLRHCLVASYSVGDGYNLALFNSLLFPDSMMICTGEKWMLVKPSQLRHRLIFSFHPDLVFKVYFNFLTISALAIRDENTGFMRPVYGKSYVM